jgi:hypothetical protein
MSTLPQATRRAIEGRLAEIHTAMPGRVETYDRARAMVSVKPLIKRIYRDGMKISLPVISNVPVIFPRSGEASLSFPLQKGDTGLILFSERSLENWLARGGEAEPGDPRRFDLTDGIFLPGLYPFNAASPAEADGSLALKFKTAKIKLQPNGKIAIGNAQDELLDIIDDLFQALVISVVPTAIGPQQLSEVTNGNIAAIKLRLVNFLKGTI